MTDIPGIGSICYPSYNINGTGPASVLASFIPGQPLGVDWVSVSEEQHVRYVVDAMAEIHGEVARESYTGKYKRRCWALDEFTAAGWASPTIGDHQVYLPQYLKTHKHVRKTEKVPMAHVWSTNVQAVSVDICRRTHFVHTCMDSLSTGVGHSRWRPDAIR